MSSVHSLNLFGILSETKRIINAHSRHFLALSVLFLLPLSFSFVVYPFLLQPTSIPPSFHRSLFFLSTPDPEIPPIDKSQFIIPIIYALFVLLFSLFVTASITHSTFHGFYGRPVKFTSSIKSILFSIFPLLVTLIVTEIILGLVFFAFGGFSVLLYNWIAFLGVDIDYGSSYFLILVIFVTVLVFVVLTYLRVEWYLANVIVVVESQWGLAPLKRSSYLMKGMRWVAFQMMLLFGSLIGLLSFLCSSLVPNAGEISGNWISCCAFVLQAIVYVGLMTIVMLYSVAATTVLFLYCKALHGELAFEIVEEFARDYISLPFDDGKVPHVDYVV